MSMIPGYRVRPVPHVLIVDGEMYRRRKWSIKALVAPRGGHGPAAMLGSSRYQVELPSGEAFEQVAGVETHVTPRGTIVLIVRREHPDAY